MYTLFFVAIAVGFVLILFLSPNMNEVCFFADLLHLKFLRIDASFPSVCGREVIPGSLLRKRPMHFPW